MTKKPQFHMTPDGREWWIDETHPLNDEVYAVCRRVEGDRWGCWTLGDTAILRRALLAKEV